LIALSANLLALLLSLHIWRAYTGSAKYYAAIFVLTYPTHAFSYVFNVTQYAFYLGLCLSVGAVVIYLSRMTTFTRLTLVVIMLIGALSIYQAVILAAPVVYCIYQLCTRLNPDMEFNKQHQSWKNFLLFGCCILIAAVGHEGISSFLRELAGISGRYETIDKFYSGNFLAEYDPLLIIQGIGIHLTGYKWYIGYPMGIIILISGFNLFHRSLSIKAFDKSKWIAVFYLIAAILSPFLLIIISGQIMPTRAYMAFPLMIGGLAYLSITSLSGYTKATYNFLVIICFISFLNANTRLAYSDYRGWQNDKLLVNRIVSTVERDYGDLLLGDPVPICFVGSPDQFENLHRVRDETIGGSMLDWDQSNMIRQVAMLRIIGIGYFKPPTRKELLVAKEMAQSMPHWPAAESIKFNDGILVIKLGKINQ
ncbi:MAG: glucosyltransferase domain-containing protein, partial [Saprospiraceae bacterium]|nr:glucosyltransferase domain-containing protein [Saprospiraceae bacterium]